MLIDSQQGPVIELVHMTERAHSKKRKTHWFRQITKIECEHSINKITAKIMRHADTEIG